MACSSPRARRSPRPTTPWKALPSTTASGPSRRGLAYSPSTPSGGWILPANPTAGLFPCRRAPGGAFRDLAWETGQMEGSRITAGVRGAESARPPPPPAQRLVAGALGESPPTPAAGLEGEVVSFASLDALKAAPPGSLSGKIALVARRMVRTQDGAGYGAAVDARVDGPGEAARRGAIAFLLRSGGTASHRLAPTGPTRYVDGRVPVPAFALSHPHAGQIERLARVGGEGSRRLYL